MFFISVALEFKGSSQIYGSWFLAGLLGNVDVLKGSPDIFGKRDHISGPAKS